LSEVLKKRIDVIDSLIGSIEEDLANLKKYKIDENIFDGESRFVVNSFLFDFTKLQDQIGAKFFKEVLFELKEIETHMPMLDILNRLEKLEILEDGCEWDELRILRNELTHEYLFDYTSRVKNLQKAMEGYYKLKRIYLKAKEYLNKKGLI